MSRDVSVVLLVACPLVLVLFVWLATDHWDKFAGNRVSAYKPKEHRFGTTRAAGCQRRPDREISADEDLPKLTTCPRCLLDCKTTPKMLHHVRWECQGGSD